MPLDRHALERIDNPISSARGIPNQGYTTSAFIAEERDHLFAKNWVCIGFTSALPQSNYALPINFMGWPFVVVRDTEGVVRVFHNVCSHRGQLLVGEPCQVRNHIRCPYHGWMYAQDGQLLATPHIGGCDQHEVASFDRAEHGLKQVRSQVWMGMIFINPDQDAMAFEHYIQPLTNQWEAYSGAGTLSALQCTDGAPREITLNANWKLAVENYCESYHLPYVHPELNKRSRLQDHENIEIGANFSGQLSHVYQRTSDQNTYLPSFPLWPDAHIERAEYISFYPNVLLGIHVDHAFAMYLEPVAHDITLERFNVFYVDDSALDDSYRGIRTQLMDFWTEVFKEDIGVVEGMQRGRASPGFGGGVFSPIMDTSTHHFHRWVAQQLLAAH